MEIENIELELWDWVIKLNEKLTTIQVKVKNRIDITEDEENIVRVLHKVWHNGELPFYKAKIEELIENNQSVTQPDLFNIDNVITT